VSRAIGAESRAASRVWRGGIRGRILRVSDDGCSKRLRGRGRVLDALALENRTNKTGKNAMRSLENIIRYSQLWEEDEEDDEEGQGKEGWWRVEPRRKECTART
jgi:hypothetical protein